MVSKLLIKFQFLKLDFSLKIYLNLTRNVKYDEN
jgi:hypothetical protein